MAAKEKKKNREILYILSGKGGTGKTFISANLGAALAEQGKKVLLVDSNFTSPNLHTFFQKFTFNDELLSHIDSEKEAENNLPVKQTDVANLFLVPGNRYINAEDLQRLSKLDFAGILDSQDVDFILIDMCAGWGTHMMNSVAKEGNLLFIVEPTPLAIESLYTIFKRLVTSRIAGKLGKQKSSKIVDCILSPSRQDLKDMYDILKFYEDEDPETAKKLKGVLSDFKSYLIMNKAQSLEDKEIGSTISFLIERQFAVDMKYLASLDLDTNIWNANKKRQILINDKQLSVATRSFSNMALNLIDGDKG